MTTVIKLKDWNCEASRVGILPNLYVLSHFCIVLNDISCKISLADIFGSLSGLLSHNPVERRDFLKFLDDNPNLSIEVALREMNDLRLPQAEERWQKDYRICLNCWRELLTLCGRDWWFNKKKTCRSSFSYASLLFTKPFLQCQITFPAKIAGTAHVSN